MSSTLAAEPTKLELCIQENDLPPENALTIREAMSPFFAQAMDWQAKIATVTDPKVARASRLVLKNIRVEAKHKKDELKETVLKVGHAIDGAYRMIEDTISPMESQLEAVEKKAEREEAERKAKIKAEREALLAPFSVDTAFIDLANMPAESFAQFLAGTKAAHVAKLAAAAKAEAERIAKEKAEAEALRIAKERAAKQIAEADAKAKAELAAIEVQAAKERKAREQAEAELHFAREQEKAKLAVEEAARKKAARAPDREKILAFAKTIRDIQMPTGSTQEGKDVIGQIAEQFEKMALWLTKKAGEL